MAEVSQRVAKLRCTVPHQLAQQLTQHLQNCRPTAIPAEESEPARLDDAAFAPEHVLATDLESDTANGAIIPVENASSAADAVAVAPLSPAPAALQSMCKAAVQRMPALR